MAYVPGPQAQPDRQPPSGSHSQTPAYSEIDSNPLPQLSFGDAIPEVVKSTPAVSPDAVREDFVSEPIPGDEQDPEPQRDSTKKAPWYKRKSVALLATIGTVAIIGILAVLFGTLGGLGVFTDNDRSTASASSATSAGRSSTSTSSVGTPTSAVGPPLSASGSTPSATASSGSPSTVSTSPYPSQISSTSHFLPLTADRPSHPLPQSTSTSSTFLPQCTEYSKYYHNASFVTGNVDMHGVGYALPAAQSQEQCCGFCWDNTPLGCNLWMWDPDHAPVPCTLLMGYDGPRPDSQCPYGHTNATAFTVQDNGNGTWYAGPCGAGGTVVSGVS